MSDMNELFETPESDLLQEPSDGNGMDGLHNLFSQLIEDVMENSYEPELCDVLAQSEPFANSVYHSYLAADGSIEKRLRIAIKQARPLVK